MRGTHLPQSGTQALQAGTQDRDASRARARPSGDEGLCPCVPPVTQDRDATTGTRDSSERRDVSGLRSAAGPNHPCQPSQSIAEKTKAHAAELAKDPRFALWATLPAKQNQECSPLCTDAGPCMASRDGFCDAAPALEAP